MGERLPRIVRVIAVILLVAAMLEAGGYIAYRIRMARDPEYMDFTIVTSDGSRNLPDADLGFSPNRNFTGWVERVISNGTVSFNVTYTSDGFGRRIVDPYDTSLEAFILFGDSYFYGYGLPDNETLARDIRDRANVSVYNYAVPGYGPEHTLRLLQTRVGSEVSSPGGKAVGVYTWISSHADRAIVSTKAYWLQAYDGPPYYTLEQNGSLAYRGLFGRAKPLTFAIYKAFAAVRQSSFFLRMFSVGLPLSAGKSDLDTAMAMLEESSRLFSEEFNGTFYVMIDPCGDGNAWDKGYFIRTLEARGVKVLDYSDMGCPLGYDIPYDGHPSAMREKDIADRLIRDLNLTG